MAKLDSKKIDSTLKSLTGVLTSAVKTLNDMTDGEFKGSTMETDPLGSAGLIIRTFLHAKSVAADQAPYDGKSVDEVAELQQAERKSEKEDIQERFNQKLAKRYEKAEVEPEAEATEGDDTPKA